MNPDIRCGRFSAANTAPFISCLPSKVLKSCSKACFSYRSFHEPPYTSWFTLFIRTAALEVSIFFLTGTPVSKLPFRQPRGVWWRSFIRTILCRLRTQHASRLFAPAISIVENIAQTTALYSFMTVWISIRNRSDEAAYSVTYSFILPIISSAWRMKPAASSHSQTGFVDHMNMHFQGPFQQRFVVISTVKDRLG